MKLAFHRANAAGRIYAANGYLPDEGYNAEALRRYCGQYRMHAIIPVRSMKRKPKPGLPMLPAPKFVTRFDKLAKSYAAWPR